ncbi:hypothetical protein SNE40_009437 [Patella caerulea]|uniref:Reverse transcriptase domain-containing protein n=1 Tax=Patella caerulea TaxID=87958 RepID=A0AAN8JSL0_PATCE
MTPFGRFCFHRLPFGINSAPEYFQKRMSQLLDGLNGVLCHMDDILVFGSTLKEHDERLKSILKRLESSGLTLNLNKCLFAQTRMKFLGHIISQTGISSDPDKLKAIKELEPPKDVHGVRRILGVVHQLGKFTPNLTTLTQPLRELLSSATDFNWTDERQKCFDSLKEELCSSHVLKLYNPNHKTKVNADASKFGLGAAILQFDPISCYWKPVSFASRTMTSAECNYPQIDKEALGVTWACEKFSEYLVGIKFHIETDHKPLVSL